MRGARIGLALGALGVALALGMMVYFALLGPGRLDFSPETLPRTIASGEWLPLLVVPLGLTIVPLAAIAFWRIAMSIHGRAADAPPRPEPERPRPGPP